jgi:hypothetical protein
MRAAWLSRSAVGWHVAVIERYDKYLIGRDNNQLVDTLSAAIDLSRNSFGDAENHR